MRFRIVYSLVLFATLSSAFVIAQQPDGAPPMGARQSSDQAGGGWGFGMRSGLRIGPPGIWWHNPDLVQKLTLTPDQQKRMDDILQQSRLQLIDLRANVEKQELLMEPMLAANPPDTNKVLAQIDRTAQARAELERQMPRCFLASETCLRPTSGQNFRQRSVTIVVRGRCTEVHADQIVREPPPALRDPTSSFAQHE